MTYMLPELYEEGGEAIGGLAPSRVLLQVMLEAFSRGIEHGHVHVHQGDRSPMATFQSMPARLVEGAVR